MGSSVPQHRAQRPGHGPGRVRHRAHVRVRLTFAGTFLVSALCAVPILTTYVAQSEVGASVSDGHRTGHHDGR